MKLLDVETGVPRLYEYQRKKHKKCVFLQHFRLHKDRNNARSAKNPTQGDAAVWGKEERTKKNESIWIKNNNFVRAAECR